MKITLFFLKYLLHHKIIFICV